MKDCTFLTVPGYGNSGPDHWHSHWERKHHWTRIEQDDWDQPLEQTWLPRLNAAIQAQSKPVILLAHSCGTAAVPKWAARFDASQVAAAFLVAPADTEQPDTLQAVQGFGPMALQRLPFPSLVVMSSNDPFVRPQRAQQFAQAWGSESVTLENVGHINTDSGHGPWPEGEALLFDWLGRIT